jgi:hypothetical protein
MGYQPRIGTRRNLGGRREKVRSKAKHRKSRSNDSYTSKERLASTPKDVVDRTINRLHTLGSQRFALPPFSEYFDLWLANLRNVLSEFESSPAIKVDDEFVEERSEILSGVEADLAGRCLKETSIEETNKRLLDTARLLERTESEYDAKTKEIESRKDREVKQMSNKIDALREELDRMTQARMGILRVIPRKHRAQREAETTQRVNSAQKELTATIQAFAVEQERLRDEYERRRQLLLEQVRDCQKQLEGLGVDGSLEARRAACDALINAVNALLERSQRAL